jgi:hypothetical protein
VSRKHQPLAAKRRKNAAHGASRGRTRKRASPAAAKQTSGLSPEPPHNSVIPTVTDHRKSDDLSSGGTWCWDVTRWLAAFKGFEKVANAAHVPIFHP